MSDKPNLIERMENLISALDEARTVLTDRQGWDMAVLNHIDNADGIAGEVLTMIDGR